MKEVGQEIVNLGKKKALFVTDKVLNQIGAVKQVTDVLDASGIAYVIFDDVKPNPTTQNVNDGLALYKKEACDFIISLGGGSPQDAAKAIGIIAQTAGTSSTTKASANQSTRPIRSSRSYVITDEIRKIKMVMTRRKLPKTIWSPCA